MSRTGTPATTGGASVVSSSIRISRFPGSPNSVCPDPLRRQATHHVADKSATPSICPSIAAETPVTVVKTTASTEKIISELKAASQITRPRLGTSTRTPNLMRVNNGVMDFLGAVPSRLCRRMIHAMDVLRLIRIDVLLLLAVANSVPVLLSMLLKDRCATPIDGGRPWRDGRPVLGPHKTWRGLLGGMFAAGALGTMLSIGPVIAAAVGLLGLVGDLVSSFIKRRVGFRSGEDWPLLDQIPEALVPLVLLYRPLALNLLSLAATVGVFVFLALGAAKLLAYRRPPTSARQDL